VCVCVDEKTGGGNVGAFLCMECVFLDMERKI